MITILTFKIHGKVMFRDNVSHSLPKKYSNPNSPNSTECILMAVSSAKQHQNYVCTRNFSLRRSITLKLLMASIKNVHNKRNMVSHENWKFLNVSATLFVRKVYFKELQVSFNKIFKYFFSSKSEFES